jgi:D-alanyl-D-alanine carboxypeptidase/D-alanyl-D-alanine-endopeptidase (penicillin-binding protein 4)
MRTARSHRALECSENASMHLTPEDKLRDGYSWQALARLLGAACLLALTGCAALQHDSPLPPTVPAALQKAEMTEAVLGVVAYPLTGPTRGLRLNPDRPQQPGSTMKVVTTIVALERLGTNARGRTDLLATDKPEAGVIKGPLYLRGGADTDLDWGVLWGMLRQVREQGVTHIQGGLVVDRNLFNPSRMDVGLAPFDESPEFQYNVIPDALNLNTSLLGFVLQSDDKTLSVRTSPALPDLVLDTRALVLNDNACAKWESTWVLPELQVSQGTQQLRFQGQFPRNCTQQLDLNLVDRQWVTTRVVRQIWRQLGGQISGPDIEGSTPAQAVVLAGHQGRPFAEVARGMMKRSDNPLTRLTYLRLGAKAAVDGEPTLAAAARSVHEWFAAHGIPKDGLTMDNGSGLSRSERITAQQMAAVLATAYKGPFAPELLTSLPVAGLDGTLSRRFKGTAVEGRARLKTGTLRNVVALAGYVLDQQDRMWVVVALLNHDEASKRGSPVLDSVVEWVAGQQ